MQSLIISVTLFFVGIVKMRSFAVPQEQIRSRSKYFPYIGLYIFGIGAIVLNFLDLGATAQCITVYTNLLKEVVTEVTISSALTAITRSSYIFSALCLFKSVSTVLQVKV